MAIFEYECPEHGIHEQSYRCGGAPSVAPCLHCHRVAERRFSTQVYFGPEDRTRFFRGADGTRFSSALGQEMPDTRREADLLAKSKGIELIRTRDEIPEHWKRAAEFSRETKRLKERPRGAAVAEIIREPKPEPETVTSLLKKSNFRLGDHGL